MRLTIFDGMRGSAMRNTRHGAVARRITGSAALAMALLVGAAPALAQKDGRQYDASGRTVGRVEAGPDRQRQYDASGRLVGRSESRGDTTQHFDSSGRRVGRTEQRGDTLRHFDSSAAPRAGPNGAATRHGSLIRQAEVRGGSNAAAIPGAATTRRAA